MTGASSAGEPSTLWHAQVPARVLTALLVLLVTVGTLALAVRREVQVLAQQTAGANRALQQRELDRFTCLERAFADSLPAKASVYVDDLNPAYYLHLIEINSPRTNLVDSLDQAEFAVGLTMTDPGTGCDGYQVRVTRLRPPR